jgi:hypothetical protein
MKRSLALVVFVVAILAACWWFLVRGDDAPSIAGVAGPSVAAPAERASASLDTPLSPDELARTAASAPVEAPKEVSRPEEAAPKTFRVRGRVCDVAGASIGSVAVANERGSVLAQSAADGTFELEFEGGQDVVLVAQSKAHVTVRAARAREIVAAAELCIVVAPKAALSGNVVDPVGAPVEGAKLSRQVPDLLLAGVPFPLDHSSGEFQAERVATADPRGRFAFTAFPRLPGVLLEIEAKGFRPLTLRLDETSFERELLIELQRPDPSSPGLEGVVVHRDGAPAEGATVRIDTLKTITNEYGGFRLPLEAEVRTGAALVAVLKGFQPAVVADIDQVIAQKSEDRAPLRIVLGPAALSISGRVLDAALQPAAKWQVQLLDGTKMSVGMIPPDLAESIAGGNRVKATTDAQGRFELRGLVDRDYRVVVLAPKSLIRFESGPIAAGTQGVELVAPADALWPKFAGRIVGLDDRPIAGVEVALSVVVLREEFGTTSESGRKTTTDAEGRFAFENVAWREGMLSLSGEPIIPQTVPLDEHADREHFEIRIGRRVHFRIATERAPENFAERAELVGEDGESAAIYTLQGSGWWSAFHVPLAEGRSQVHSVVEGDYTVVFKREDDIEIERRAAHLVPGEVQVIEY